jgi:hypothetical protein
LSDDRSEPVDLTFIGRALQRLTSDVVSLRDDMHVLTAIVLRHDREFERLNTKLDDMLEQLRAMVRVVCPEFFSSSGSFNKVVIPAKESVIKIADPPHSSPPRKRGPRPSD